MIPVIMMLEADGKPTDDIHTFCSKECFNELVNSPSFKTIMGFGSHYEFGDDYEVNHDGKACIWCGKTLTAPKPKNDLSFWNCIFLLERTDFSEPWMSAIGMPTRMRDFLIAKAWAGTENDEIRIQAVEYSLNKLGLEKNYKGAVMGFISAIKKWLDRGEDDPIAPLMNQFDYIRSNLIQIYQLENQIVNSVRAFQTERERLIAKNASPEVLILITKEIDDFNARLQPLERMRVRQTATLRNIQEQVERYRRQVQVNTIKDFELRVQDIQEVMMDAVAAVKKKKQIDPAILIAADWLDERGLREGAEYIRNKVKEDES